MVTRRDEDGFVLVVVMAFLLVLTIVGIAAIQTSTVENLMAGNSRIRDAARSGADAGMELSKHVIRMAVGPEERVDPDFRFAGVDEDLPIELSKPFPNDADEGPSDDLTFDVQGRTVTVDIDFMTLRHVGDVEFGAESVTTEYYRVNSTSTDNASGTEVSTGAIYRYIRQ